MATPRQPSNWHESMRQAGPYLGLGMQLAMSMVFFTGGGLLIDRWLGSAPAATIVGAILGMIAVFTFLFRMARMAGTTARPSKRATIRKDTHRSSDT